MEQIRKHVVSSRRANPLKKYQQNCMINSNALYYANSAFAELSANAKRVLGLSTKKVLDYQYSKERQDKEI